jgi:hypothetical protein
VQTMPLKFPFRGPKRIETKIGTVQEMSAYRVDGPPSVANASITRNMTLSLRHRRLMRPDQPPRLGRASTVKPRYASDVVLSLRRSQYRLKCLNHS